MRTILFLVVTLSFFLYASCSDPILWTIQNEEKIATSNLSKTATAKAFATSGDYYYVALGMTAWRKPIANPTANWVKVGSSAGQTTSLGFIEGVLAIATQKGVFAVDEETGKLKDYPDGPIDAKKSAKIFNGKVYAGKNDPDNIGNPIGFANGTVYYSYDAVYAADDNLISWYQGNEASPDSSKAIIQTPNGNIEGKAIALLDNNLGQPDLIGLAAVGSGGYREIYINNDGVAAWRAPSSTVNNADAYTVTDLSGANILSFYAPEGQTGVFFVLTSNYGLWRNTNGTWYRE